MSGLCTVGGEMNRSDCTKKKSGVRGSTPMIPISTQFSVIQSVSQLPKKDLDITITNTASMITPDA